MIKKVFFLFSVLFFAALILFFSVIRVSAKSSPVNPRQQDLISPTIAVPTATPTATLKTQYYLPYPGILPDHPFYPFKMIRDRIWLWLTTDSLKKAELMVLFADKRIGAAEALIRGNKIDLGASTLEKAEKYLERAVGLVEEVKKKGKDTQKVTEKLQASTQKHQEVIASLEKDLEGESKLAIGKLAAYPKQILERIAVLKD